MYHSNEQLFAKARRALREEGYLALLRKTLEMLPLLPLLLALHYYRVFKSPRTFKFEGKIYGYFYHWYNTTWRNERTVEVPIIWDIVKRHYGQTILEVGNVLSHYFPVDHDILDKYEKGKGIIDQDAVRFQPCKQYDLIVSISTLEHIGWTEELREPEKVLRTIENLKSHLSSQGKIVCTLPLGFNAELDEMLRQGKIRFTRLYCLKRISKDNTWIEVSWEDLRNVRYGYPYPCANGLLIGIIEK